MTRIIAAILGAILALSTAYAKEFPKKMQGKWCEMTEGEPETGRVFMRRDCDSQPMILNFEGFTTATEDCTLLTSSGVIKKYAPATVILGRFSCQNKGSRVIKNYWMSLDPVDTLTLLKTDRTP